MLAVTEVAEGTEEYRNNKEPFYLGENGKPEGEAIELLDCYIRLLDLSGFYKIDLDAAFSDGNDHYGIATSRALAQQLFPEFETLEVHFAMVKVIALGEQYSTEVRVVTCLAYIEEYFTIKGWDMDEMMEAKTKYNQTRAYRHGGKLA